MIELTKASVATAATAKRDLCQSLQAIDDWDGGVTVFPAVDDEFIEVWQLFKSRKVGLKKIAAKMVHLPFICLRLERC